MHVRLENIWHPPTLMALFPITIVLWYAVGLFSVACNFQPVDLLDHANISEMLVFVNWYA